jgi:hypothetical protein
MVNPHTPLKDYRNDREHMLRYIMWKLGEEHARLVVKPQVNGFKGPDLDSVEWLEYRTNQDALWFVGEELKKIGVDWITPPASGTLINRCVGWKKED